MNNIGYWERESTKEELKESLNKERLILSTPIIEYLNSLLELEFSVLKNEISEEAREVLSEYTLYKRIAMYNIYNRALKIINDSNVDVVVSNNIVNNRNLEVSLTEKYNNYFLFKFFCGEREVNDSIRSVLFPKENPIIIGDINLYKLEENELAIKKRLNEMQYKLDEMRHDVLNKNDPNYLDYLELYKKNINQLKELIQLTDQRIKEGLSLQEKNAILIVNMIRDRLLCDYGLTENDFSFVTRNNSTGKTLVRKYPKLTVSDTRHYI